MFCSNCGKELSEGAKFCGGCGRQVKIAPTVPVSETATVTQESAAPVQQAEILVSEKPKKKKTGLVVFIILLVLLLGGGAAVAAMNWDKITDVFASEEDDEDEDDADDEEDDDDDKDKDDGNVVAKPEETPEPTPEPIPEATPEPIVEEQEGEVLNIYCFNDEFLMRVEDYYPGYEKIDYDTGKIGDVQVNWTIIPYYDYDYQGVLDMMLLQQSSLKADEKIDLFLIESMYADKYVDSVYTLALEDLGITEEDLSIQYDYTKEVVTDNYGQLKGVTWQAHSGVLYYNREIAESVLSSYNPEYVQYYLSDWDTFMATAELMNDYGYNMVSSVYDTYRTYAQNATTPWVVNGRVNIDQSMLDWAEDSKLLYEMGAAGLHGMWSTEWRDDMYPENNVFCYFGPDWLMRYSMRGDEEGTVAYNGGWGATEGPGGFFWGGTWLCAAVGTDNEELIKDIMLTMTTDSFVQLSMVTTDNEFVNNKEVMEYLIESEYSNKYLGGQNPIAAFANNAERIDMSNTTAYDTVCDEAFQNAMTMYFKDQCSFEEALEMFYINVLSEYPELSR